MRPEVQLLCLAARGRLPQSSARSINALLAAGCDLDYFTALTASHDVSALVFASMAQIPEIPWEAPAWAELRARALADVTNSLQIAWSTRELLLILRRFPIVPLKGAPLAAKLYGQFGLRQVGDIDILVRRDDLIEVWRTLVFANYKSEDDEHALLARLRSRDEKHTTFRSPVGVVVEVHWSFHEPSFQFRLRPEDVFANAVALPFAGITANIPNPEHLLILLAVHGCRHGWNQLKWICDVAELASGQTLDWSKSLCLAVNLGVLRMVLLALRLAHDLLGATVPDEVLRRAADRDVDALVADVSNKLFGAERLSPSFTQVNLAQAELDSLAFEARCRERHGDRLALTLQHVFSKVRPTLHERALLGQIWAPRPVLWIVRPFRLLRHYGLALLWSACRVVARIVMSGADETVSGRAGRN